jgi:hypothetical protein
VSLEMYSDLVNPGGTGSGHQERHLQILWEGAFQLMESQPGSSGCSIAQDKLIAIEGCA